jgi:sugar lactone lactonase YvrE
VATVGGLQAGSQAFNTTGGAGSITTYAGKAWQFTNPGNAAMTAPLGLGFSASVATDAGGTIYVADPLNHMVFRITGLVMSVVAGTGISGYSGDGGPAVNAQLNYPSGVAVDASGNVYIADQNNNRIRKVTSAGVITTIAGNGNFAFSGDGGPATSAAMAAPRSLAVDGSGNIYIGDQNNYRIRKVDNTGKISTIAGNGICCYNGDGAATSVQLGQANALTLDANGVLYIGEQQNRIRKLSGGTLTLIAGTGNCCFNGDGSALTTNVDRPSGLAVASDGSTLWFMDQGNNRLRSLSGGNITSIAGDGNFAFAGDGGPQANAEFANPSGLARDSSGNFYIADGLNKRIRKITSGGTISTIAGNGGYRYGGDGGPATNAYIDSAVSSLTTDSAGNLFIGDGDNHVVRRVDTAGTITTFAGTGTPSTATGDGGAATSAGISTPFATAVRPTDQALIFVEAYYRNNLRAVTNPGGVISSIGNVTWNGNTITAMAVDSAGNYYMAAGPQILKVAAGGGATTTFAGTGSVGYSGDGALATQATFNNISGIAINSAGDVFIADTGNRVIRMVNHSTLNVTTVAGNGGCCGSGDGGSAISATFNWPTGVAVDGTGHIFVADRFNNSVRMFTVGGTIKTVAGTAIFGTTGDGGPATSARLAGPFSIALDSAGNLYIGEADFSGRIRKVTPPAGGF